MLTRLSVRHAIIKPIITFLVVSLSMSVPAFAHPSDGEDVDITYQSTSHAGYASLFMARLDDGGNTVATTPQSPPGSIWSDSSIAHSFDFLESDTTTYFPAMLTCLAIFGPSEA
jgi:hypothetical protein